MKARLLIATALVVVLTAGRAGGQEDPALDQVIAADEAVVDGPAELVAGHVDLGPRFVDGTWELLVRDDAVVPSVWRDLDETVVRVPDAALRPVPDDPTYGFLGAAPGDEVHLLPQLQSPDVVWLGWNTQHPEVMSRIDRGITLTLRAVEGPGQLTVYLQSGNLTEPEVLWTSTSDDAQPLWVDVNTHTHANWVFTEPGTYLALVDATADLIDGSTVTDRQLLRFAVGDATPIEQARTADLTVEPAPGEADQEQASERAEGAGGSGGNALVLVGIGAAVLLVAGVIAVGRSGRARKAALAERTRTEA